MPDTRIQRRHDKRRTEDEEFVVPNGVIGWAVDRAFDNPAAAGGIFVMALTVSAIVSNALFLQNARHPEPLFSTRPPLVVDRQAPSVPLPPRREEPTGSIAPPLPRAAPVSPITVKLAEESMLREIQSVLASKGLYLGAVDGVYGSLSRSAITAYQEAQGLDATGEPSAALLEHLKTPEKIEARLPDDTDPILETTSLPNVDTTVANGERLRYERVQAALNRIGYGPVVVDGAANEETANAIRRFELDNGLPISGAAGEAVIDRLIAIGALPTT